MASLTRNGYKTAPEATQKELDFAKAVVQAHNYLSKVVQNWAALSVTPIVLNLVPSALSLKAQIQELLSAAGVVPSGPLPWQFRVQGFYVLGTRQMIISNGREDSARSRKEVKKTFNEKGIIVDGIGSVT